MSDRPLSRTADMRPDVPGGDLVARRRDPRGATFALRATPRS